MRTERNPNANKFKLPDGYKDLGWQRHSGNCEEIKECYKIRFVFRINGSTNRKLRYDEITNIEEL